MVLSDPGSLFGGCDSILGEPSDNKIIRYPVQNQNSGYFITLNIKN